MSSFSKLKNSLFLKITLIMGVLSLIVIIAFIFILIIALQQNSLQHQANKAPSMRGIIVILGVITVSMVILYFYIKKQLSPIKFLNKGALAIAKGNFDIQLPVNNQDELAELTTSFNRMAKEVRTMIEARERLLTDVSHEIRTPLTRLRLASEFLPETHKQDIIDEVIILDRLTQELLLSNQLKRGFEILNIKKNDLLQTLQKTISLFDLDISQKITIHNLLTTTAFSFDENRLHIILKNILENAVKYSPIESLMITIELRSNSQSFYITIIDNGDGIPETDLPHVFEPFYRVDTSRASNSNSFGLGLNLCKKIVEAHNGTISIKNNAPITTGISVTLEFPVV